VARRFTDAQRGLIYILIGTFCFSAKAVLVKLAYHYPIDAVTLLTLRMGLSLPFYLVIGWFVFRNAPMTRLTPRDHALVIGYGVAGYYLASLFDLMGLQYISAGFERLILYLYPTIVLLLSALFFKRRISGREWLALLLGYLGIALVYARDAATQGPEVLTGMVLILLCALTFAIYVVGSGQMIPRIGAMSFTTYAMTVACVAILIHFVLTRPLAWLAVRWELWMISGAIAVFSTVLPTFLMAWGIKLLGAPRAALIGAAGPMFTAVLGYYALGEPFTLVHAAGTVLVVGAVLSISTQRSSPPARANEDPEP
jgi:drug/metabolite transporter (DMT)-like permease